MNPIETEQEARAPIADIASELAKVANDLRAIAPYLSGAGFRIGSRSGRFARNQPIKQGSF
jgi:hypothetical protein